MGTETRGKLKDSGIIILSGGDKVVVKSHYTPFQIDRNHSKGNKEVGISITEALK